MSCHLHTCLARSNGVNRCTGLGVALYIGVFALFWGFFSSPASGTSFHTIELQRVLSVSGLQMFERIPIGPIGADVAANDLVIRCWSYPSTEWHRFSGRFGAKRCHPSENCEFNDLFLAFMSGASTVAAHLKDGDEDDALAVMALFANEPDMAERLLKLLPPVVVERARTRFEPLSWLWEAVRSKNIFYALAREYALDRPYRGDRMVVLEFLGETDPFLTVGRSLSFSRPDDLERAILDHEKQAFADGRARDQLACPIAYGLFEMANIKPRDEVVDAYQRVILGGCGSEFHTIRFVRGDDFRCCGFFAIGVLAAGRTGAEPGRLPPDRLRFARMRLEPQNNDPKPSPEPSGGQPGGGGTTTPDERR